MSPRQIAPLLVCVVLVAILGGCAVFQSEPPRPGRTTLSDPLVVLPAKHIGNYLIVEAQWDRYGPYNFLIDTGSSVTHISPELAARYPEKKRSIDRPSQVRVKSANGKTALLPTTTIQILELGEARFEDVEAVIYDTTPLSAHLGIKIDGILGFPLFRETLLTLDYPQSRILLAPHDSDALVPGTPVPFRHKHRTPLIPIKIGSQIIYALVDSGSDAALNLNTFGLSLDFQHPPRPVAYISTLTGDHVQEAARLNERLTIADQSFINPITYLTGQLTSIGGEVLKHFTVTFDQERSQVSFQRDSRSPLAVPSKRGAGLSFRKTPAYWRVANVVPNSPANAADIKTGDLVSRINGESVAHWDFSRYEELIAQATAVTYTFLKGTEETALEVSVIDLVP